MEICCTKESIMDDKRSPPLLPSFLSRFSLLVSAFLPLYCVQEKRMTSIKKAPVWALGLLSYFSLKTHRRYKIYKLLSSRASCRTLPLLYRREWACPSPVPARTPPEPSFLHPAPGQDSRGPSWCRTPRRVRTRPRPPAGAGPCPRWPAPRRRR